MLFFGETRPVGSIAMPQSMHRVGGPPDQVRGGIDVWATLYRGQNYSPLYYSFLFGDPGSCD